MFILKPINEMKWIYPFIATFIRLTACQILISNTECPAVDELVRVNEKNSINLRLEMEELKKERQRLSNELSYQRDWIRNILVQSNGKMDCLWYKKMDPYAQNGVYNLIVGGRDFQAYCDMGMEGIIDCMQYKIMDPDAQSGVYNLIVRDRNFQAYCDMETDGGGWTVIVSRDPESSINMNRSWHEYKNGFGNVAGPFYWIGNDNIHELTKQRPSDVYFKLEDKLRGLLWSKYKNMTVLSEEYKYRLSFDENSFVGSLYDWLGGGGDEVMSVHNMAFTTYDSDNDGYTYGNCAVELGGGWWYNDCGNSMTHQSYIIYYSISVLRPGNMMMIRYKKPK